MKRSTESDPQKQKLHQAECEFYPKRKGRHDYSGRITQIEARRLIGRVRNMYGLSRISLRCLRQPRAVDGAYAISTLGDNNEVESSEITFPGTNPLCAHTLLHELAHVVVDTYFGYGNTQDHGPEFVGVMSYLFQHFQIIPADALGVILRRYGVKRRPVRYCSPDFLKKFRDRRLT